MKFLHLAEGVSCNARVVCVQVLYGSSLYENSEASPLKYTVYVCVCINALHDLMIN